MALISYRSRSLLHEVAALLTLKANWFNALTVKQWEIAHSFCDCYFQAPAMQAMLLFPVANEETPYGQLLHYWHSLPPPAPGTDTPKCNNVCMSHSNFHTYYS